jgi:hypothetical protein
MLLFAFCIPALARADDRNWIVYNVFETFYPMPAEDTFPENLSSLETIYQLSTKRTTFRNIERSLHLGKIGQGKSDLYGDRSDNGHNLVWIHLSDEFLATHTVDRNALGSQIFLFPDRETDIVSAWSGDVNLVSFLTTGVQGFAVPIPGATPGTYNGNFQNFSSIWPMGDADYEAGWYMNDDQAARILTAFQTYPGLTQGYSFMRTVAERPNAPYEPQGAQLVNGYNCNDFVWYALDLAGIVPKSVSEQLKVQFWYPRYYYDHTLPLKDVGAAGMSWLDAHPGVTQLPGNVMTQLGWFDLLFSPEGLQFFDKRAIVDTIVENQLHMIPARIWDQTHEIAWLVNNAEFRGKGFATEILPTYLAGGRFTTPVREVEPDTDNRWSLTTEWARYQADGDRIQHRKLRDAHLTGEAGRMFQSVYESLKDHLPMAPVN